METLGSGLWRTRAGRWVAPRSAAPPPAHTLAHCARGCRRPAPPPPESAPVRSVTAIPRQRALPCVAPPPPPLPPPRRRPQRSDLCLTERVWLDLGKNNAVMSAKRAPLDATRSVRRDPLRSARTVPQGSVWRARAACRNLTTYDPLRTIRQLEVAKALPAPNGSSPRGQRAAQLDKRSVL